ncbi:MAG: hypothetical protein C0399_09365 [Syntrophus sp. (in: bacteria)]|nr:hypothetical protein [Syntrophus sp. (in: bacteria)]
MFNKNKKYIAWGASPIFELYLRNAQHSKVTYCVDSSIGKQGKKIENVPIYSPEKLFIEDKNNIVVINFGHSSTAIQSINKALSDEGFILGDNYLDFAVFIKNDFELKAHEVFGKRFSHNFFTYARSFNFNSITPLETTVLGNWLLLEVLNMTNKLSGSIAEVGAYKGGNAYFLLSAMILYNDMRKYYIFDSFRGFNQLSDNDPKYLQDAYNYDYNFNLITNLFSVFQQSMLIKGFVPETFNKVKDDEKFSLVFFDCDLYQPALDTYNFFWNRVQKGGFLIIHDNVATEEGWSGVRKATSEYFGPKGIKVHDFWETTMSVIIKE